VTVAVSLADKLDTALTFYATDELPTGSKDPFALRRAALGIAGLLIENGLRLSLKRVVPSVQSLSGLCEIRKGLVQRQIEQLFEGGRDLQGQRLVGIFDDPEEGHFGSFFYVSEDDQNRTNHFVIDERLTDAWYAPTKLHRFLATDGRTLVKFLADRLKVQQREAGVRHDLIDAVFALGGEDDLVRLLARVRALQAFVETPEGADLLAGYKRAANILKKEGWPPSSSSSSSSPLVGEDRGGGPAASAAEETLSAADAAGAQPNRSPHGEGAPISLSYTPEPEENALISALDSAEPRALAAIAREDFEAAMAALATLRGPVDAFFDKVNVNEPAPDKRAARLDLLARMRNAVHRVADFSRVEG